MNKPLRNVLLSVILTSLLWLLLGAGLPAPIWRNNFSTNQPPFPVIGTWRYSNTLAGLTNFFVVDNTGISGFDADGTSGWGFSSPGGGVAGLSVGQGLFSVYTRRGTYDLQMILQATNATVPSFRLIQSTGPMLANYLQIEDSGGNAIAYMRSNVFWATTNDFYATLQTTDNTTNIILTITPRDNSVVRCKVDVVGYNSVASASYGKTGTYKSVAGTVTQISAVASVAVAEDDVVYECLMDTSANTIRVRVAGNTGRTVNWKCYLNTTYSE